MKPLEQPFIQGERCYLRPLTREDLDGNWSKWLNDPEVTRHMFRGAFPESEESNKAFYESVRNSPNDLVLAIVAADGDVHVGNVGTAPDRLGQPVRGVRDPRRREGVLGPRDRQRGDGG